MKENKDMATANHVAPNGKKKRGVVMWILIIMGAILLALVIAVAVYMIKNTYEYKWDLKGAYRAGFEVKQATTDDGDTINYAEGPDNGPALLLIHGQGADWTSYSKNLPTLSKYYNIFAVDCYGHGKSSKNPEKYSANAIGTDLAWFIKDIIGEPAVVSGHSSGGLLTAWLAANAPEQVREVVLEDPPFFSCEDGRKEKATNYHDLSTACHTFLEQDKETDFTMWYFEHQFIWGMMPASAKDGLTKMAKNYREKHPDEMLVISILPQSWMGVFNSLDDYDPRFGETFYNGEWNKDFDHADTLSRIQCKAILIHADWSYDDNGILLGAMDDQDAKRANELMANSELVNVHSMHCVHALKAKTFDQILIEVSEELQ